MIRFANNSYYWLLKETAKFYKALSMIGTDFTMIQRLFANRNRDEIKRKFKREEKLTQALIDKILSRTAEIDLSVFVSDSSDNEEKKKLKSASAGAGKKVAIANEANGDETTTKKKRGPKKKCADKVGGEGAVVAEGENAKEKNTQRKKLKRIEKRKILLKNEDLV